MHCRVAQAQRIASTCGTSPNWHEFAPHSRPPRYLRTTQKLSLYETVVSPCLTAKGGRL